MSEALEDYVAALRARDAAIAAVLDACVNDARRCMGAAALQHYLEGARGLAELGRGARPVVAWLEAMPQVARELGDDTVQDSLLAAMKLSSMTSGEVIALFFDALPTAARRLGDVELLRAYLNFLHQLAARAPRALRPMLGLIDELLGKLTLGGLRQWAFFGADAYRSDFAAQQAYFALASADSKAVLQQARKGVLFVDHQRKLAAYLRALWGRDFWLRPAAADYTEFSPHVEDFVLYLPDAVDDGGVLPGLEVYRAISAHLAAHLAYSPVPPDGGGADAVRKYLVALFEDARVEYCAMAEFPGLRQNWGALLAAAWAGATEHPAQAWLQALVLALFESGRCCGDAELDALAVRFHDAMPARSRDASLSTELGAALHALLKARSAVPSLRQLEQLRPGYRDDNRVVWAQAGLDWQRGMARPAARRQLRRRVSIMEMVNEVEVETAGDDADEVWTLDGVLHDDDGSTFNDKYGREAPPEPFHYPEWDYQVQIHRPDWVSVLESRQRAGDGTLIADILARHKGLCARLRQMVERLRPQGVQRVRKLEDGDELDLNAAVEAMVDLRSGHHADLRVTLRHVLMRRDLAVLILLDLSASTNDVVAGSTRTVLELTREAATVLATAVERIGDPFAIHGFCSDGRQAVHYLRVKDFGEHFGDDARARLAAIEGACSTRMGAALRHAGHHLCAQPQRRKLLLLVTDGEPADVDERDPQYLRHDARKAVEELRGRGVDTFCLSLDPAADRYVARIFGASAFTVVDSVARLPERLPALFGALTR